jgi:predicted metal-binding protein
MQPVKPKWLNKGLVLVCERCSTERIPEEAPEVAERMGDFNLRDWLKSTLKEDGRWGEIRVISTSCMDVCARGRITVAIAPEDGETKVLVVDPLDDKAELYAKIVKKLDS